MGSCAAPSAKGDDKFITTDYLQQCRLSTILEDNSLPLYLSQLLLKLQQHYHYLVEQIKDLESQLKRKLDEDEVGC
jgi:hypothetical protein